MQGYFHSLKSLFDFLGCLWSSTLGSYPRPPPLGSHLVGPRPQFIARLNAMLLFNFEVVITLTLNNVFFLFLF